VLQPDLAAMEQHQETEVAARPRDFNPAAADNPSPVKDFPAQHAEEPQQATARQPLNISRTIAPPLMSPLPRVPASAEGPQPSPEIRPAAIQRQTRAASPPSESQISPGRAVEHETPDRRPSENKASESLIRTVKAGSQPSDSTPTSHLPDERPATPRVETSPRAAEHLLLPVSSIIQPRPESRSRDARSGFPFSQPSVPEPVIQVTIGRIEVRATSQAQPAQKARSAPPMLSLDEYLRQKRKGA
jgi:hypothetical protein